MEGWKNGGMEAWKIGKLVNCHLPLLQSSKLHNDGHAPNASTFVKRL